MCRSVRETLTANQFLHRRTLWETKTRETMAVDIVSGLSTTTQTLLQSIPGGYHLKNTFGDHEPVPSLLPSLISFRLVPGSQVQQGSWPGEPLAITDHPITSAHAPAISMLLTQLLSAQRSPRTLAPLEVPLLTFLL